MRPASVSASGAYALRRRADAQSFRQAWDFALEHAISRLSDAAFSRALNGVATPVFFQGQQIGERRRYNERLTMFMLRYRDPVRYGAWLDAMIVERQPDAAAAGLAALLDRVEEDAVAREFGDRLPRRARIVASRYVSPAEAAAIEEQAAECRAEEEERRAQIRRDAAFEALLATPPDAPAATDPAPSDPPESTGT